MFNFNYRRIYLDYASLTPVDSRVMREIKKYSSIEYANPSSFYKEGVSAKKALKDGRAKAASFIHALPNEIIFTSGGTESNNFAIIGAVESLHEKGVDYKDMHVIVSVIEHSSVRECANYLSGKGVVIDVISVDKDGIVSVDEIKNKLRSNTVIVSVMTVNNEIGSIQPIREIAKIIRQFREKIEKEKEKNTSVENSNNHFNFQSFQYPIFHTDASQAALCEDLNVERLGVDLLTLDGSKVYGPRGIGLLFIKKDTPIVPIIYGGGQEFNYRSGTENIPAIMGLAKAFEIITEEGKKEVDRISKLKEYFISQLKTLDPNIKINGGDFMGAPHILNVFIPKIDNEFFVLQMDAKGICCSTKSSCLRDEDESYVLKSIGADSKHSIRFSLGRETKIRDLKKAIKIIGFLLAKLK